MGLFGSSKGKRISRKEQKRIENEERLAKSREALNKARELESQGNYDDAVYEYYCSIDLPEGALAYLEFLKKHRSKDIYFEKCRDLYSRAYDDKGYAPIIEQLAYCYYNAYGTCRDVKKAYDYMEKYYYTMNMKVDSSVHLFLGRCSDEIHEEKAKTDKYDTNTYRPDYRFHNGTTENKFSEAAQMGNIDAMLELGKSVDPAISYKYLKMGCEKGSGQAAADMFWRFIDSDKQHALPNGFNVEFMCESLKKGAQNGNTDCMFALALCYVPYFVGGFGLPYNYTKISSPYKPDGKKFIYWLKKAYENGSDPCVKVMMAQYYATGKVWKDYNYNPPIFKQSEKEIDIKKAFALAKSAHDEFVDLEDSFKSYRQGIFHNTCKYLLGVMYFYGFGTDVDVDEAHKYVYINKYFKDYALNEYDYYPLSRIVDAICEANGFTIPEDKKFICL